MSSNSKELDKKKMQQTKGGAKAGTGTSGAGGGRKRPADVTAIDPKPATDGGGGSDATGV